MLASWTRSAKALGAAVVALGLGTAAGCGDGTDEPALPVASSPGSTLHADLVEAKGPVAIAAATAPSGGSGSSGGAAPKVIYLVYADGKTPMPATSYNACSGVAPKFNCSFGTSLLDCQQQIQTYLDRWYADFNVIFTLTRPTSGSFYTEVISSGGGAWCGVASTVAGVAPFLCQDLHGGVAYTLDGGASAHDTAVIIAQEQAHLLGLEHVSDDKDIMYPFICKGCDGFENQAVPVTGDKCDRQTQNSYQMMMAALGSWGGGPKPSAFGCINDTTAPVVKFLSPGDHQKTMGHDFAVKVDAHDDCELSDVTITVEPQGLSASASKGPYEWDLTGVDGDQTITVTAADAAGHTTVATLAISVPSAGQYVAPAGGPGAAGCTMASGAFGAAGLVPSLAMLLVFIGRSRRPRKRRRVVSGALAE